MTQTPDDPWGDHIAPDNPIRNIKNGPRKRTREEMSLGGKARGAEISKAAADRRRHFLRLVTEGALVRDAIAEVGVNYRTYARWRKEHKHFRHQVDLARGITGFQTNRATDRWDGHFIEWRKKYLGADTPWFQAEIVDILENAEPGTVTLVLIHPAAGKTTMLEDWITYKFCTDKSYRITYGSESQGHSRKVLLRVRNRLEDDSPFPDMVDTFGPFSPRDRTGDHKGGQPWGQDAFDIYGKTNSDERDYTFCALGFGSQIAGTRTDLLIADDMISMNNVNQSKKHLETFRQDWLSRPGAKGRTVIIGTRVQYGDLYDMAEREDGLIDHIVRFKAHDPERTRDFGTPWLWPERYNEAEYENLKSKAGPDGWARNYQQAPRQSGDSTFTDTMLAAAANPVRSVVSPVPDDAIGIGVGLDPGFGVNGVISVAASPYKLYVLGGRKDVGLTNNSQIFSVAEAQAAEHITRDAEWLEFRIEDKAFQKGLLDDEALHELQKRYGFHSDGHTTGSTKYDPDIGIPAMARDFRRGAIDLPGADDEPTNAFRETFDEQLLTWRPYVKGTLLEMDLVMAFWFIWLWWRDQREFLQLMMENRQGEGFQAVGLPWGAMGLDEPTRLN